jgi:four helix bundle protein
VTKAFPADERFNMVQQVRRGAISVVLNIAEGCTRKSETERKRFFEISRGSLLDAAFDVANELEYFGSNILLC